MRPCQGFGLVALASAEMRFHARGEATRCIVQQRGGRVAHVKEVARSPKLGFVAAGIVLGDAQVALQTFASVSLACGAFNVVAEKREATIMLREDSDAGGLREGRGEGRSYLIP